MVLSFKSFASLVLGPFRTEPAWRGGEGDVIALLDDAGVIHRISASARDIIGAAGDFHGRSLYDFVRREDRAAVKAALCEAMRGDVLSNPSDLQAEFRLLRLRRAPALAEITFRRDGKSHIKALIRERRREAASPATAAEPTVLTAANANNSALTASPATDIMADLAHEMKTPLNAIMGFADAMRAETFGPLGADAAASKKYAEYLNHIHASGAHLTALIGAAQDFAKTKSGKYEICRAETRPAELAGECAAMLRGAAEAAGLSFLLETSESPETAMLDARAVKQILINLLSNAVKFTKDGEIALSVSGSGDHVSFTVRDTGVGMNKIVLAKLGGRYSDTHQSGVRGAGGSGLGLSLAFELARLHGGDLRLASTPGEGTTATLQLPLRPENAADQLPDQRRAGDIQSQLDRVNAFRRERVAGAA